MRLEPHLQRAADRLGLVAVVALATSGQPWLRLAITSDPDQTRRQMQQYHAGAVTIEVERWARAKPWAQRVAQGMQTMLSATWQGGNFWAVDAGTMADALDAVGAAASIELFTEDQRFDLIIKEAEREVRVR